MLRVEDPPRHAIPEVCQGVEDDAHVDAAVRAEQAGNVLHENGSGSKSRDDPVELVPESGALPREPGAASCNADILAGEPTGDEVRGRPPAHGVVTDPAGNRKLDKSKATGRIDGIVAGTMAVGTVDRADQLSIQPGMEWL